MSRLIILILACWVFLPSASAEEVRWSDITSSARFEKRAAQLSNTIDCQQKQMDFPARNSKIYLTISTTRICVPNHSSYAYDRGLEAHCIVKFHLNGDGTTKVDAVQCKSALNGNFEADASTAGDLKKVNELYGMVSGLAVEGWKFDVMNELEAENLGPMVLPFKFEREDGTHHVEPLKYFGMSDQEHRSDELVTEPEGKEDNPK